MKKFRFAIIGCERMSFKHIEGILNDRDEAEFVAVCDMLEELTVDKAEDYRKL